MKHTEYYILDALADKPLSRADVYREVEESIGRAPTKFDAFFRKMWKDELYLRETENGLFELTARGRYAYSNDQLIPLQSYRRRPERALKGQT